MTTLDAFFTAQRERYLRMAEDYEAKGKSKAAAEIRRWAANCEQARGMLTTREEGTT